MPRLLPLLLAFMLLTPALAEGYPTVDHSLQDIPVIDGEQDVLGGMTSLVLREWNATDLSAYKANGVITLEVKGHGSFDVGVGETLPCRAWDAFEVVTEDDRVVYSP